MGKPDEPKIRVYVQYGISFDIFKSRTNEAQSWNNRRFNQGNITDMKGGFP